ncbi:MAG: hypothetical protein V3R99_00525 [Thermoguttaceae bacterium]
MKLIQINESTAERRRIAFDLRDAIDGITPETSEGGGQPQRTYTGLLNFSVTGTLSPDVTGTDTYAMQSAANEDLPTYYDSTAGYYLWQRDADGTVYWYLSDTVGGSSSADYWWGSGSVPTTLSPAPSKVVVTGGTAADGTYLYVYDNFGVGAYYNGTYWIWYNDSGYCYITSTAPNQAIVGAYWERNASTIPGTYTPLGGASGTATATEPSGTATGDAGLADGTTTGMTWTDAGIGTLTHIGSGRYYADLMQATVDTTGRELHTRYKSANTADTPGDSVRVVAYDPLDIGIAPLLIDLDQIEAAAPVDSLCGMVLMAMHSNTRDNSGKITVYRTDDTTEFAQLAYTTDPNAYPIDGVS